MTKSEEYSKLFFKYRDQLNKASEEAYESTGAFHLIEWETSFPPYVSEENAEESINVITKAFNEIMDSIKKPD